jgi:hypothetical protein
LLRPEARNVWKSNNAADAANEPGKFTAFARTNERRRAFRTCTGTFFPIARGAGCTVQFAGFAVAGLVDWITVGAKKAASCSRFRTMRICRTASYPTDVDFGRPIDKAWPNQRDRNEHLIEIKQIRVNRRRIRTVAHDEFANYEVLSYLLGDPAGLFRRSPAATRAVGAEGWTRTAAISV